MKPETLDLITDNLTRSSALIDEAVTLVCEVASAAILERHWTYARALCDAAENAFVARGRILNHIIHPESKPAPKPKEVAP